MLRDPKSTLRCHKPRLAQSSHLPLSALFVCATSIAFVCVASAAACISVQVDPCTGVLHNVFANCVVSGDVDGGNAYGGGVSLYIGAYSSVFSSNGDAVAAVGDTGCAVQTTFLSTSCSSISVAVFCASNFDMPDIVLEYRDAGNNLFPVHRNDIPINNQQVFLSTTLRPSSTCCVLFYGDQNSCNKFQSSLPFICHNILARFVSGCSTYALSIL